MARSAAETYRKATPRLRLAAKLVKRSVRDDYAATHYGDPIRHQLGLAQHVGRDDERGAARSLLAEIFPHVRGRHGVESRGRLVAKDPIGLVQGGADQSHLLSHAPRVGGEDRV